jgi:hypothetical protein
MPYHDRGIGLVHEYVAPHGGIEQTMMFQTIIRTNRKPSIEIASLLCTGASHFDGFFFTVNSEHSAVRSNGFSDEHRKIANTAPQIQNSHARANSTVPQQAA